MVSTPKLTIRQARPMSDVNALVDILQPHLRLHRARLVVLAALMLALVRFRTTNLARLCLAIPGRAHETSAYRRLQRFFADVALDAERLHSLLLSLAQDEPLTLALDRTEWKTAGHTHNLLVVGYLKHGVVVPLAWQALGKRGSSHQRERIALLTALFERLPPARVAALLGDREFIGKDFLGWLERRGISFVVRVRKNAWIECVRSGVAYQAAPLFALLGEGRRRRLGGKWQVYGTMCFVTATRRQGSTWVLISNRRPNEAEVLYRQRWQIETLFGTLWEPGLRPGGDAPSGPGAYRAAVRGARTRAGVGALGGSVATTRAPGAARVARSSAAFALPRGP